MLLKTLPPNLLRTPFRFTITPATMEPLIKPYIRNPFLDDAPSGRTIKK
jgi:hypothetical protein